MNRLVALLALVACTANAFTATPPAFVSQLTRVMSPLAMADTVAEAPASTGLTIRYARIPRLQCSRLTTKPALSLPSLGH
jgi:hypothetical protein